jgi:predicted HicB family RNase H-like nuclease
MVETESQKEVIRVAEQLYAQNPDWVTFFREILGLNGIVRQMYPTRQALTEFEKTEAYADIQQMLTKLREQSGTGAIIQEPTRVITVRLPKSLHEALRAEAHEHHTSMNKLCISKLLQFIDNQFIPTEP